MKRGNDREHLNSKLAQFHLLATRSTNAAFHSSGIFQRVLSAMSATLIFATKFDLIKVCSRENCHRLVIKHPTLP
jgi:hypothetical protein